MNRYDRLGSASRIAIRGILLAALVSTGACGGGASMTTTDVASEAEWRSLRSDRPVPIPGAALVTVAEVDFLGAYEWTGGGVSAAIGVSELVAAGLMRREDVDFVERRRFSTAAEAEERGDRRRPGQPPAGVSRSVEFSVQSVWIPLPSDSASVEVRLVDMQTGQVVQASRRMLPSTSDPVLLARAIVGVAMGLLGEAGRRPVWSDPLDDVSSGAATNATASPRVPSEALGLFLGGLAAEERWNWEGARRGYQAAAEESSFHEAATLLARAARLRLGGTLAEN